MTKLYVAVDHKRQLCKIGLSTNPPMYIHHLRWKYIMDFKLICHYPLDHKLFVGSYGHVDMIIRKLLNDCTVQIENRHGNVSREIYSLRYFPVQKIYEFLTREACIYTVNIEQLPKCKVCNQSYNFMAHTLKNVDELIAQMINSICCRDCAAKLFVRIGSIEECVICHESFTVKYDDMQCCSTKCEVIYNKRKAIPLTEEDKERRNKRTWQI